MPIKSNGNIPISNNKNRTFQIITEANYTQTDGFSSNKRATNFYSNENGYHPLSMPNEEFAFKQVGEVSGTINKSGLGIEKLERYEKQIEGVMASVYGKSNKPVHSFDIETIGSTISNQFTGEAPLPIEKEAFAILEVAVDSNTWENGGNRKTQVKKNLAFGIDKNTEEAARLILDKYIAGGELTGAEMSTVNTLAKIGATSRVYGGTLPTGADGTASYVPASNYNKYDTVLMNEGINALRKLDTNPDGSSKSYKLKGTDGRKQLVNALNLIQDSSNQGWLISQNGKGFDIPVLEAIAKENNIPFNVNKNNHVDRYEIISDIGYDMTKMYPKELNVTRSHGKLETQAKITEYVDAFINSNPIYESMKGLSHTGIFDTGITTGGFDVKLDTLGGSTLMEDVLNTVREQKKSTQKINANKPIFRAVNSLDMRDLSGGQRNEHKDLRSLDHITETFNFSTDNGTKVKREFVKESKLSLFRTNNFYEMLGVERYTTNEFLERFTGDELESSKRAIEASGDTGEIFVARFLNKTSHNNETSFVVRNSYESVLESVNSTLQVSDLSQDAIEKERTTLRAREMEKRVASYVDSSDSTKGYASLEKDLSSHRIAKQRMLENGIAPTRENFSYLIRDGHIKDKNGKLKNREEVLKGVGGLFEDVGLEDKKENLLGINERIQKPLKLNSSRATEVLDSFEWMNFHEDYYKAIQISMRTMEKENPKINNRMKTLTQESIDNYVMDVLKKDMVVIDDKRAVDSFVSRSKMVSVNIGEADPIRLNTSSNKSLEKAISSAMRKDIPNKGNKRTVEKRQIIKGQEIVKGLVKNGVLTKADQSNLRVLDKPYEFTMTLRDTIQKRMKEKTSNLSERDLSNPEKARDYYKKLKEEIRTKPKTSKKEKSEAISKANSKIKELNFLFRNTDLNDSFEREYKNQITLKGMDGDPIVGENGKPLTLNQYLKANGHIEHIEKRMIPNMITLDSNATSEFITSADLRDKSKIGNIRRMLGSSVSAGGVEGGTNYFEDEVDTFIKAVFGEKGLLDRQKGTEKLGATVFYEETLDKNMKTAYMILAPETQGRKVKEAIASNTYKGNPHMAVIELPSTRIEINNETYGYGAGPRLVGKGSNVKVVEDSMEFYFKGSNSHTKTSTRSIGQNIGWNQTNSVKDILKSLKYAGGDDILDNLLGNQGGYISSKINSRINDALGELRGPSTNNAIWKKSDGSYITKLLFNQSDYSNSKSRSIHGMVDLLPLLYGESSDKISINPKYTNIRTHMRELFKAQNNPDIMDADDFFETWRDDILSKGDGDSKYAKKYGKDGLRKKGYGFVWEDFVLNFATEDVNYLGQIRESDFMMGAKSYKRGKGGEEQNLELEEEFEAMEKKFSRMISESGVGKGMGSLSTVSATIFGGDIQSGSRPMISQIGNYLLQDISHMSAEQIKELSDHNIHTSAIVDKRGVGSGLSKDSWGFEGFTGNYNDPDIKVMEQFTTNIRMINEEGIKNSERELRDKLLKKDDESKRIENALWDALFGEKERNSKDPAKNKKFDEMLEFVLTDFSNRTTFEQRVNASPMLSALVDREVRRSLSLKNVDKLLVADEEIVKHGGVIGLDSKGNQITHKGREMQVIGVHDGKLAYKELKAVNTDRKIGSGAEKGTMAISSYDSWGETRFAQVVFEEMYGKGTNAIANYNLKGHKSPSFAYERISNFALEAVKNGGEDVENFTASLLRGLYVQNADKESPTSAEVVRRFKDTPYEARSFRVGANTNANDAVNAVEAYSNVKGDIELKSKEAYDKAMKGSDNLTDVEKFLSNYHRDNILTHDENVYTVASALLPLEDNLGSTAGKYALDHDNLTNKSAKMGFRELFFLGRNAGTSDDAFAEYFDVKNGKIVKSMGQVISKNVMREMERNPKFQKKSKDLNRLLNASKLMYSEGTDLSSATPEQMIELENKLGLEGKVKHMSVDDIKLNSAGMSPEHLADTVFGVSESEALIRVDLGESNIQLDNPITGNKTNYLYLANLSNEFTTTTDGERMFVASEHQKAQVKLLDSIQRLSTETTGNVDYLDKANSNMSDLFLKSLDTINNKDSGMILREMYNQSLPFSGTFQFGDMLEHTFDENLVHSNSFFNKNLTTKVSIGGKETEALLDIVWTSESDFVEKLGKRGIKDIGYDLAKKSDFDSNQRFKDTLVSKGILDADYKIKGEYTDEMYDAIGRAFLETEGLDAIQTRSPVFNPNGQVAVNMRLRDESLTSVKNSAITTHFITAAKLNADSDGDLGTISLQVKRGEDGRAEMYRKGTEVRDAHARMMRGQAIDNHNKWNETARAQTLKSDPKKMKINEEIFVGEAMLETGGTGNFQNGDAMKKFIKAKFDKQSIGPISNVNIYNNQLADMKFFVGAQKVDRATYDDIVKFGSFTEQNMISVKKTGGNVSKELIGNAAKYREAMNLFNTSTTEDAVIAVAKVLNDGGSIDLDSYMDFYAEEGGLSTLYDGTLSQRRDYIDKYMSAHQSMDGASNTKIQLRGLASLKELYDQADVQAVSNDPLFKHNAINKSNMASSAAIVLNDKYNKDTFAGMLKSRALSHNEDNLEAIAKANGARQGSQYASEATFIDKDGGAHYVDKNTYIGNDSDELLFRSMNESGEFTTHSLRGEDAFVNTDNMITDVMDKAGLVRVNDIDLSALDDVSLKATHNTIRIFDELERGGAIHPRQNQFSRDNFHKALIDRANGKTNTEDFVSKANWVVNNAFMESNDPDFNHGESWGSSIFIDTDEESIIDIMNPPSLIDSRTPEYTTPSTLEKYSGKIGSDLESTFNYKPIDRSSLQRQTLEFVSARMPSLDEISGATIQTRAEAATSVYTKITDAISLADESARDNFKSNFLERYSSRGAEMDKFMGWDIDSTSLLDGLDSATGHSVAMNSLGEARIYAGDFTNQRLKDMSFDQIETAFNQIEGNLLDAGDIERKVASRNLDSITKYREHVLASMDVQEKGVSKRVSEAMHTSNLQYEGTLSSIASYDIPNEMKRAHKELIEKAMLSQARLADEAGTVVSRSSGMGAGKAFMIGAGLAVAGSLIAGSIGVAGRLDPHSKEGLGNIGGEDSGVVVRKNSPNRRPSFGNRMPMMERRTSNINTRTSTGQSTDNITNALKVNYGADMVRVNVNNEDYSDNNNNWFENEMANQLM